MRVCDDNHEEICYEGRGVCPLCEIRSRLLAEAGEHQVELYNAKSLIDELKKQMEKVANNFSPHPWR